MKLRFVKRRIKTEIAQNVYKVETKEVLQFSEIILPEEFGFHPPIYSEWADVKTVDEV